MISPSVFHAVGRRAARVLTLHNYRLLCPAAIPMREGKVCTDCIRQRSVLPALQHGCYRNSRLATVPLATNVALHRGIGTWQHQVDAFVALSDFQRNLMADGGLPKDKIHVKPNFYAGSPVVQPYAERPGYIVFVGRLGEEKACALCCAPGRPGDKARRSCGWWVMGRCTTSCGHRLPVYRCASLDK